MGLALQCCSAAAQALEQAKPSLMTRMCLRSQGCFLYGVLAMLRTCVVVTGSTKGVKLRLLRGWILAWPGG